MINGDDNNTENGEENSGKPSCEYEGLLDGTFQSVGKPEQTAEEEYNAPERYKKAIIVPKEAENYSAADKLRSFVTVMAPVAVFVAGVVFLLLKMFTAFLICIGCFAVILIAFFAIFFISEKRAVQGKGVLGKNGTKRIPVTVVACVCSSRAYQKRRYGNVVKSEVVDAVYRLTLSDGAKKYVAKCKTFYYPREEVFAYVSGRKAYIDDTEQENIRQRQYAE